MLSVPYLGHRHDKAAKGEKKYCRVTWPLPLLKHQIEVDGLFLLVAEIDSFPWGYPRRFWIRVFGKKLNGCVEGMLLNKCLGC